MVSVGGKVLPAWLSIGKIWMIKSIVINSGFWLPYEIENEFF